MKFEKKYVLTGILTIFLLYLFWGPLFPWSPLKIGYEKFGNSKVTVYIHDTEPKDSVVKKIYTIIETTEMFHGLKFKDKFTIIVTGRNSDMRRFIPWQGGSGYSVSLEMMKVIYIGPNARMSPYGIETFIKHELSHQLIYQNTSTNEKKFIMQGQSWFVEGIAIYYGGPFYYSKKEVFRQCTDLYDDFSSLYEGNIMKAPKNEIRFRYAYYGYFIGFLIDNYGHGKLIKYLRNYIESPVDYKHLFAKVYQKNIEELLKEFRIYMQRSVIRFENNP